MKHQDIVIRSARVSDHEDLCDLWEELDAFHRVRRPDLFQKPDRPGREPDYIASLIEGPESALLVAKAREGAGLIGLASLICRRREASSVQRARSFVEIDNLTVASDQRRRGVGRALMRASKTWATAQGISTIELSALAFNRGALAFYKSNGFETRVEKLALSLSPRYAVTGETVGCLNRVHENKDCVFCKIVSGEAEASVVFEDDEILAFMTLRPTRPGEMLIIPKDHIDHFCDISDELSARMMVLAQKFSRRIRSRLGPDRVGMVISGYGVAHAHLIVVPLHEPHDIVSQRHAYLEGGEIRYSETQIEAPGRDELNRIAALLRE